MELRDRLLDPAKARRGVWFEYEGAKFLIRHMPNPESTWTQLRFYEAWRAENNFEGDDLPDHVTFEAVNHALAEAVLLEWQDVTLDGEAIEATKENKFMALEGDTDFRSWVIGKAMDRGHFRAERIAKEAEALGNASSGASRGGRASKNSKP